MLSFYWTPMNSNGCTQAYQHMYLTREGDTIPNIRKLNQYYDMSTLFAMTSQEYPKSPFDMHLGDQHTLALNYLLRTIVHIAQDVT